MSRQSIPSTGLTAVVNPPKPSLDIVFVHGFTGHPVRTWTHNKGDVSQSSHDESEVSEPPPKRPKLHLSSKSRQESCHTSIYWPEDLVPSTVPNARVLTYGYDTHIRHKLGPPGSRNTVYDIAWDFLVALEAERHGEPSRPIIFVVHSLGGIVVKEVLRRSSECYQSQTHLREIYVSTIGIMFFGTPHSGADPRGFLHRIAEKIFKAVGFSVDEQIVNSLLPSSERLKELRDAFGRRAYERNWIIYSFQEQIGLKALGDLKVVEDTSSCLGLPTIEITQHIVRNHMEMCRFSGPNDFEYRKVDSALRRMTSSISKQPFMEEKSTISREQTRLLVESLRFDQINARQMTIRKAHVKTCRWLFTKSEYLDWLDQAKLRDHLGFLWIKGKPGTGKSTLMKSLLANAKKLMKGKVVISYFFNARGEELEKSTLGTYQSLLLQLLEQRPTLESVFETLDLSIRILGATHQWSVDSLKSLLEEAILRLGDTTVVCFIDALDECDEQQIRDMISFFEHVGQLTVSAGISFQVCFSSRHYPHITIRSGITLVLEGQEGHTQDITTYLESDLKIGHSKVAEQIRLELQEKASGVFLWVVLVVEILNKEHDSGRIHALRRRLREIPGDLNELFTDILTRDSHSRDELILCLQWVLFARQPLTPEQLYFAIISGSEPQDLSIWDPNELSIYDIQRFILNASKGLAETTTSKTPKVQFIHESVKDFLVKENGLGRIWSDLGSNFEGQSHERLKRCCVEYMNMDFNNLLEISEDLPKASSDEAVELRQQVKAALPFLEYATHNVLYHADMAEGLDVSQESFICEFQLTRWIWLKNLLEKHHVRRHTPATRLVYILAENDLPNLIKSHPVLSFFETGDERYGCPLFAALATSSEKAVSAFLQACAASQPSDSQLSDLCQKFAHDRGKLEKIGRDFQFPKRGNIFSCLVELGDETLLTIVWNIKNAYFGIDHMDKQESLSLAARIGSELTVKQLLEAGAHVELVDSRGLTPLMVASEGGHIAVVKLMLEFKADVNCPNSKGRTPLMQAAQWGRTAVVKLLLEIREISVDSKDHEGNTPLLWAVQKSKYDIVKLLLNTNKVDVNSKDNHNSTPLSIAVERGNYDIVKLLLDTDKVDVNSKDENDCTPFFAAMQSDNSKIVKLFLASSKVNINSKDRLGNTPLIIAARRGREEIAKLLLQNPETDVNLENHNHETALSEAARYGHDSLVILLLNTGKIVFKSIYHTEFHHSMPIKWATYNGHRSVVKLLLDTNEFNVNTRGLDGNTALQLAVRAGSQTIVKMLLDTNKVDVNSKNRLGDTALLVAANGGFADIVKLLIDTPEVDVDSKNQQRKTPLTIAIRRRNSAIIKLLLDTGKIEINSRNEHGDTALMTALHIGDDAIVRLLLDTGKVDLLASNDFGQTAQSIAADKGNKAVVQMLEDYLITVTR